MNKTTRITLELPAALHARLLAAQEFSAQDLQPGETVPTIEELILEAVGEAWGGGLTP